MTRNEIIENGWVEKYVLGLTSEVESSEVERLANLYPEVQDNINLARNKICGTFNRSLTQPALRDALMNKRKMMVLTILGVAVFSLGFAFLAREHFSLRAEYNEQGKILAIGEAKLSQLNLFAQSTSEQSDFIHSPETNRIKLTGTGSYPGAEVVVFRSGETGRMLLRIVELPSLPQGQYFEVWSEQKPKPDRLVGLIKPPLRYDILYTLDSMINASALLVKGVANAQGKSLVVCQASIVE